MIQKHFKLFLWFFILLWRFVECASCGVHEQNSGPNYGCEPFTITYKKWSWSYQFNDFAYENVEEGLEPSYQSLLVPGAGRPISYLGSTPDSAVAPEYYLLDGRPLTSSLWHAGTAPEMAYPASFDSWWPDSQGQMVHEIAEFTQTVSPHPDNGALPVGAERWAVDLAVPPADTARASLTRADSALGAKAVTGHIRMEGYLQPEVVGADGAPIAADLTVEAAGVWVFVYVNGYLVAGCYDIEPAAAGEAPPTCTARVYLTPTPDNMDEGSYSRQLFPVPGCWSTGHNDPAPANCEHQYFPINGRKKTRVTVDIFTAQPRKNPDQRTQLTLGGTWAPRCTTKCFSNGGGCRNGACQCPGVKYGLECGVTPSDICYRFTYDRASPWGALDFPFVPVEVFDDYGAGTTPRDIYAYISSSARTGFESPNSLLLGMFHQSTDVRATADPPLYGVEDLWLLTQFGPGVPDHYTSAKLYARYHAYLKDPTALLDARFNADASHPYSAAAATGTSRVGWTAWNFGLVDDTNEQDFNSWSTFSRTVTEDGSTYMGFGGRFAWIPSKTDGLLVPGLPVPRDTPIGVDPGTGRDIYDRLRVPLEVSQSDGTTRFHFVTYAASGGVQMTFGSLGQVGGTTTQPRDELPYMEAMRCCAEPLHKYTLSGLITDPGFLGAYGADLVCNNLIDPVAATLPAEVMVRFRTLDIANDGDFIGLADFSTARTDGTYDMRLPDGSIDPSKARQCSVLPDDPDDGTPEVTRTCAFAADEADAVRGRRLLLSLGTLDGATVDPLDVHFLTDSSGTASGFRAEYSVLPSLLSTDRTVTFEPPPAEGAPAFCVPLSDQVLVQFKATNFDPRSVDAGCAWANRGVMTRAYHAADPDLAQFGVTPPAAVQADPTAFFCQLPAPSMVVGSNLLTTIPFNITNGHMDGAFSRAFVNVPLCASVSLEFSSIATVDGNDASGLINTAGTLSLFAQLADSSNNVVISDIIDPLSPRDDVHFSENMFARYACVNTGAGEGAPAYASGQLNGPAGDFVFDPVVLGWVFSIPRAVPFSEAPGRCDVEMYHSLDGGSTVSVLGLTPPFTFFVSHDEANLPTLGVSAAAQIPQTYADCQSEYVPYGAYLPAGLGAAGCVPDAADAVAVTVGAQYTHGDGSTTPATYSFSLRYSCTTLVDGGGVTLDHTALGMPSIIVPSSATPHAVPLPDAAAQGADLHCTVTAVSTGDDPSLTATTDSFVVVRRSGYLDPAAGELIGLGALWVFSGDFVAEGSVAFAPAPVQPVLAVVPQPALAAAFLDDFSLTAEYFDCVSSNPDDPAPTPPAAVPVSWAEPLMHRYASLPDFTAAGGFRTECSVRVVATHNSGAQDPVSAVTAQRVAFAQVLRAVDVSLANELYAVSPGDPEHGIAFQATGDHVLLADVAPLLDPAAGTVLLSAHTAARVRCQEVGGAAMELATAFDDVAATGGSTFTFDLKALWDTQFFRKTAWICVVAARAVDDVTGRVELAETAPFAVHMPYFTSVQPVLLHAPASWADVSFAELLTAGGPQAGASSLKLAAGLVATWRSGETRLEGAENLRMHSLSLTCAAHVDLTSSAAAGTSVTLASTGATPVAAVLADATTVRIYEGAWPTVGGVPAKLLVCTAGGTLVSSLDIAEAAAPTAFTLRGPNRVGAEWARTELIEPEEPVAAAAAVEKIIIEDDFTVVVTVSARLAVFDDEVGVPDTAAVALPPSAAGSTATLSCTSPTAGSFVSEAVVVEGLGPGLRSDLRLGAPRAWVRADFEGAACTASADVGVAQWTFTLATPSMPLHLPADVAIPTPAPPGGGGHPLFGGNGAKGIGIIVGIILLLLLIIVLITAYITYQNRKTGSDSYAALARAVARAAAAWASFTGACHALFCRARPPPAKPGEIGEFDLPGMVAVLPPAVELA